jgi:hypothetical protein
VLLLAGLATLTAAITNLDSLAQIWSKYFTKSTEIAALDNALNQPTLGTMPNSSVELELVQVPASQDEDAQVYDVYLNNKSQEDVLLTSLSYGNGYLYTSADSGSSTSREFEPNASYTIPVQPHKTGTSALSPPYLLKRSSRGAIRFRFTSDSSEGAPAALAFSLLDSGGKKVASIGVAGQ